MTGWKAMRGGSRALLLGGGAVVVVSAGMLSWSTVFWSHLKQDPFAAAAVATTSQSKEPETLVAARPLVASTAAGPVVPNTARSIVANVATDETPAPTGGGAPADIADVPTPHTPPPPAATGPAFDVVRVDPSGAVVVAGRAQADADVSVQVDGVELGRTKADGSGKFVALFSLSPNDAPSVVTLQSTNAETVTASTESVIVAPIAQDAQKPNPTGPSEALASANASSEGATPEMKRPQAVDITKSPDVATQGPAVEEAATAVGNAVMEAPPTLLLTDQGGQVLQSGGPVRIDPRNVTIDAISYAASGAVQLAGRGPAGAFVRLYIDNAPVLNTEVTADGRWVGALPDVSAGVYTLRADLLNANGRVTSRYETPFQREAPERLAAAAPDGRGSVAATAKITVQPGFTLWGIARQNYGDGVMYVRVYEANKTLIRDPDLIYPGQVFSVPAGN